MTVQRAKFYLLYFLFVLLGFVSAVRKKRHGAAAKIKRKTSMTLFAYIMMVALLCIFVPLLAYFAYKVAKDPTTPVVIKQLWQRVKERCTGYLGKKRNESMKSRKNS